jgi:hypothetical protein
VVAVGLLTRVAILPTPHILSDDAFRYAWDGRVAAAGINPFVHTPDDPALAHLRTSLHPRINHPDLVTVYPPVAQVCFLAAHVLGRDAPMRGLQLVSLSAELLTWIVMGLALARHRLPWTRLTLLAWFPLLWVQGYAPGHTDLWGLPFVVGFGIAVARRRAIVAGVCIALAAMVKPMALAFLPAVVRTWDRRRSVVLTLSALAVAVLAYLPFLSAGDNLFASAELMARKWSFNGSVAEILERTLPERAVRPTLAALLVALVSLISLGRRPVVHRALLLFTAVVVSTTTLYPWYLAWMFPLLAWRPDPALLVLGSTVAIADLVVGPYQAAGVWEPKTWHAVAVYAPFYVLLLVGARRRWGMFGGSDQPNLAEKT